ncbi:hypothetical protein HY946_01055 [Candidatus Gottesmanbacteria bacterium]|nr:hypothetical protein [Candidatus Gottesmanbacteria bacterium]
MRNKEVREVIFKMSEGLLASATDLVLYLFFLTSASFFKPYGSRGVYESFAEADELINQINYRTFKNALGQLKRNGLLDKEIKITQAGRKRLNAILPSYDKERIWNKRIYLITYDIPTNHNRDRDLLREYLRRIGCTSLQESVWLTPYNPREVLAEFTESKGLHGTILVSNLGLDGKIGDEDLKSLLKRVYKLDQLNEQYQKFIDKYKAAVKPTPLRVNFDFYHLLSLDPQLPFELLPKDWQGEKAYRLFLKLSK